MTPAAVAGFSIGHPAARYFAIPKIGRDQLEDWARRRGCQFQRAERWLAPLLLIFRSRIRLHAVTARFDVPEKRQPTQVPGAPVTVVLACFYVLVVGKERASSWLGAIDIGQGE